MMLHYRWLDVGLLVLLFTNACALENSPKRISAYLPTAPIESQRTSSSMLPVERAQAILVVLNDVEFSKSAPSLRPDTLESLGEVLGAELQKQLPIELTSIVYPTSVKPGNQVERLTQLARDRKVPYLLLAVVSSSEWEVPDRLPLGGFQQPTGLRSSGLVGYRAENYARVELALLDSRTKQSIVTTDGQAWATLERLAVPLESNVYPVVRRAQTQPPIYPHSEKDAFETLRWVSGQDAIAQAVMRLGEIWPTKKVS